MTISASSVSIRRDRMVVRLEDGNLLLVPFNWFEKLSSASEEQRRKFQKTRFGLHWEDLDEDLSFSGLLRDFGSADFEDTLATADDILAECRAIVDAGGYDARLSARKVYESKLLPELLQEFGYSIGARSRSALAKRLEMSSASLSRIQSGGVISENLLFRIFIAAQREKYSYVAERNDVSELIAKPWRPIIRNATKSSIEEFAKSVQLLISQLNLTNSGEVFGKSFPDRQRRHLIEMLETLTALLRGEILNAEHLMDTYSSTLRVINSEQGDLFRRHSGEVKGSVDASRKLFSALAKESGSSSLSSLF